VERRSSCWQEQPVRPTTGYILVNAAHVIWTDRARHLNVSSHPRRTARRTSATPNSPRARRGQTPRVPPPGVPRSRRSAPPNPVLDAFVGGWEVTSINTAHTGMPLDVTYGATGANIVSSLSNDYRGQPFLRPNVSGSATSQSRSAMLNTYFAGYTFTTPPASAPYGNVGRNSFQTSISGTFPPTRTSVFATGPDCNSGRNSSTSSTTPISAYLTPKPPVRPSGPSVTPIRRDRANSP
jgi:hypothetical protein